MAKKTFAEMNEDERAEAIRPLMKAGHTNKTAAEALGTTPGTIAGIRHRKGIPSRPNKEKPRRQVKKAAIKKLKGPRPAKQKPEPVRFVPPAPTPLPVQEPEDKPKPPYKLASMRHLACDEKWEDGRLCDYVHEEGSRYCKLHNWMRRHPRI